MKKLSLKFRLIICFLCMAGMTWIVSAVLAWYESRELSDEFFDTYHYIAENEVEQFKIATLMELIEQRIQNAL